MRPIEARCCDVEDYNVEVELKEIKDGMWQVVEKRIYTFNNEKAACNKVEQCVNDKVKNKKHILGISEYEDDFEPVFK